MNRWRDKLGEILRDMEKNKGAAANAVERNNRAVPTLSEIGISKNLSSEA